MKFYIAQESTMVRRAKPEQEFYSLIADLDDGLAEKVLAFEETYKNYQTWLGLLSSAIQQRGGITMEQAVEGASTWLDTVSVDVRRKRRDTEAPSSKMSLGERKRMEALPRTSQKKAE